MNEKPRVVIDTQVLLRAVANRHSLPARIVFDLKATYVLLVSEATTAELEDVLHRPKVRDKFGFTDEIIAEVMERLSERENINITEVASVSRDPKDDIFLACALTGNAQYIVSEDKDL